MDNVIITKEEITEIRTSFGFKMTAEYFSHLLGVSRSTVIRYENGDPILGDAKYRFILLKFLMNDPDNKNRILEKFYKDYELGVANLAGELAGLSTYYKLINNKKSEIQSDELKSPETKRYKTVTTTNIKDNELNFAKNIVGLGLCGAMGLPAVIGAVIGSLGNTLFKTQKTTTTTYISDNTDDIKVTSTQNNDIQNKEESDDENLKKLFNEIKAIKERLDKLDNK
ncbi:MAG: hypothetical protein LBR53_01710 [Deltaproteobacteria bacterium]|jgi:transcriptional regulator with XRE-family HTH domain|nr:hypothetical protein [Deltaproteobacteria bacterium]